MVGDTMRRWFNLLVLVIALQLTGVARAEEKYVVKMDRPLKVGQKYHQTVTSTVKLTITSKREGEGPPPYTNEYQVELAGQYETLAVDDAGHETKVAITVEKCTRTQNGETQTLIEPGEVLIADGSGDETRYFVNDKEVSDMAKESLGFTINIHNANEADDDEIFGTTEKQPVGATWSVNAELAAKDFMAQCEGIELPKNVKGQVQISGIAEENGVACMRLEGEVQLSKLSGKMPGDGNQIVDGSTTLAFAGLAPIDPSLQWLAGSNALEMRLEYITARERPDETSVLEMTVTTEGQTKPIDDD